MAATKQRKVPARAFQLAAGPFEFAGGDGAAAGRAPIKLTASSGQVFNHWFWGPMVIDNAGMQLTKNRLTLDYCHNPDEIVGFADNIQKSDGKLVVAGQLVSVQPGDRASEIAAKGAAGVPYEASIKFDSSNGLVLEEYQPGSAAVVNGRSVPGPLTVIRQCLLRGIAVCPYGADPYTDSEFSVAGKGEDVTLTVNLFSQEGDMPATATESTTTKSADEVRAELVAQTKDYSDRFGAELAANWGPLGENKPLLECYAEFCQQLRGQHAEAIAGRDTAHAAALADLQGKLTAAEAKVTAADARIASLNLGEQKPVSGGGKTAAGEKPKLGITPAQAAFAAAFTLPQSRSPSQNP
jgi:hypothetical protein